MEPNQKQNLSKYDIKKYMKHYFYHRCVFMTPLMIQSILIAKSPSVHDYLQSIMPDATKAEPFQKDMTKALDEYVKANDKILDIPIEYVDSATQILNQMEENDDNVEIFKQCVDSLIQYDEFAPDLHKFVDPVLIKYTSDKKKTKAQSKENEQENFDTPPTPDWLMPEGAKGELVTKKKGNNKADEQNKQSDTNGVADNDLPIFGGDLTEKTKKLQRSPIFFRDREIGLMENNLLKMNKNNVILVGKPGVGKTALVEGLAYNISHNLSHPLLKGKKILSFNVTELMAGTLYRGDLEENILELMDYAKDNNCILFIDEIHSLVTGSNEEENISDMLKPYLNDENIRVIGATTDEEYRKMRDMAFNRRFNKIDVPEPDAKTTLAILKKLTPKFTKRFHVQIPADVLEEIVSKSDSFIHDRCFPDKAIDLLDYVCVLASKEPVEAGQKYPECSKKHIIKALTDNFNVPENMVAKDEHVRMLDLEKDINGRVFGQQDAIKQVSDTLVCSYVLPNHSLKRPQSVMLFLGPSGVGKTETAKTIAELLGRKFTSLNMNEYQTDIDVSRLMGSAPGYVGYEEGGKLTNFVSKNPCSVVLFDEFEKAHPNVQKILLQIFDQGTCTNNYGDDISFKNTIIILASNAGSVYDKPMGYSNNAFVPEVRVDEESISKIFMPEFLGRINRIVKFNALSKPVLMDIVNRLVSELSTTLKQDHNVNFVINDDVKNFIINQGYKPELGARKIQNTFVELVEQPVSYQIIQNYTNWHQPNGKLKKVKNPHELIAQLIGNKINFISK